MQSFSAFCKEAKYILSKGARLIESWQPIEPLSSKEQQEAITKLSKLGETGDRISLGALGWNVPDPLILWGFGVDIEQQEIKDKHGKRVKIDPKTLSPTQPSCLYDAIKKYISDIRSDLPIIYSVQGYDQLFANDHTRITAQLLAGRHRIDAIHYSCIRNEEDQLIPIEQV